MNTFKYDIVVAYVIKLFAKQIMKLSQDIWTRHVN